MIQVENLKKRFGPRTAVNGVSFSVERGEILGFLGPNGAGKSTTMRMLTGFIPPDEGRVTVCGFDVATQPLEAKRRIGYLPESAPSYPEMTVGAFLRFCAEIRGFAGKAAREAVGRAVERCFLEPVLEQPIETLSKGYRHRTGLAQAILHDPEVLVLDEPTDGLDPNQKHEVRQLIRSMGETRAIIFSTHILEEVEAVCTRALVIDRGGVVANGTPEALKRRSPRAGVVKLGFGPEAPEPEKVRALLGKVPGVRSVCVEQEKPLSVRVEPDGPETPVALAIHETVRAESWKIDRLETEEGRLDEVFRSMTLGDQAERRKEVAA